MFFSVVGDTWTLQLRQGEGDGVLGFLLASSTRCQHNAIGKGNWPNVCPLSAQEVAIGFPSSDDAEESTMAR